jgi:hypothetical protein
MGEIMSKSKVESEKIKFLYKNIFLIVKSDEDKSSKKNKIIQLIDQAIK